MMTTHNRKTKRIFFLIAVSSLIIGTAGVVWSGQGKGAHQSTSHGTSEHGSAMAGFSHEAIVDGIRAEFQVMSLATMKIKDPKGNTHHIMARFFDKSSKTQLKEVIGKVKIISPSEKEQVASLEDFNGTFAANFTFKEKGKYGVICLFKISEKKRLVKFWYDHG
jgi:hypothetical protein